MTRLAIRSASSRMYADTSKATHHNVVYGVSSQTTNMTSTTAVPIACRDHGTNWSQTSQATLTTTPGASATETMRASRLFARRTTAPTAGMPSTVAGMGPDGDAAPSG